MSVDLYPAAYIWLDLFPASVSSPDPMGDQLRVIVTDNRLYVLEDTVYGPEAKVNEPLDSFSGNNQTGYTVITDTGAYVIVRAQHCGCGSGLRGFHPFPGVPYRSQLEL